MTPSIILTLHFLETEISLVSSCLCHFYGKYRWVGGVLLVLIAYVLKVSGEKGWDGVANLSEFMADGKTSNSPTSSPSKSADQRLYCLLACFFHPRLVNLFHRFVCLFVQISKMVWMIAIKSNLSQSFAVCCRLRVSYLLKKRKNLHYID